MKTATAESTVPEQMSEPPVRVAVVVGSNREGRFGPVVAGWLLDRIGERDDFLPEVLDVASVELPTALSHSPSPAVAAELAKVSPALADADAFIVLTPEYNHSFPAGLKNLIDWHYGEWRAKPVALVSYGGVSGGLRAVEHLRQVFAELHAVTVRDTVSFHGAGAAFDEAGHPRDAVGPAAAVKTMLDQLGWWARALKEARGKRPYGG
ncbi:MULTISPECIES: NADPH-dependent FMN reductase [unclassified Streptomyces]|uniref:NADPH-dependent FMN reductase n=1 Tax=unclassified Streptomyces TaxID=2593676 RepID=UPI0022550399|nr:MULTISPECIES: NAD(P)H-dependent oxidoreductase [unclassified Streptomyces]MCX4991087.1 NAD(P)H-dependent oxidoreductase [Streptomyces sp. NBC_00568]MCX5003676.1 NAD(P)H-dependent oxidoreductase [Streptomyces sp. NBC_00638]